MISEIKDKTDKIYKDKLVQRFNESIDILTTVPEILREQRFEDISKLQKYYEEKRQQSSIIEKEIFKKERNMDIDDEDKLINSSLLSIHIHNKLKNINETGNINNFSLKTMLKNLTLSEIFNIPGNKDEILESLKTTKEKNNEIKKRLYQIDDAFRHKNLTFIDIIEILGNVKISDLAYVYDLYK